MIIRVSWISECLTLFANSGKSKKSYIYTILFDFNFD